MTILGLLPETMFWTVAATILKYTNAVHDALVEDFTALKL